MVKQTIQIYARIKPNAKNKTGIYDVNDGEDGANIVTFTVPRDSADGYINNKKETHKFKFESVFDQKTKQDEVFDLVAKPVIDNVLEGYNGTIFAYGQTGSGKTFTITGGAERYIDRGIIPRSISYIFQQFKQTDFDYSMHISYLEIYNENGYDLLDPKHDAAKLEDLPKVSLMEDVDQNIHLKNLSVHPSVSEEDALNLLFLGDTNRMIAETPMNQASTRSHCIFTIHVTARAAGSATIRRAKLHLVDLAGSERVSKTGTYGVLLTEAKYINLSLHFLEQVIISLSEKNRSHIPYRNSMMTSVLRDSLGGNCMTTMIATLSMEKRNIDESISTCRFAQRVALIKNEAILNEELDPKLMIERLQREVNQLKEELALATGEQRDDELTEKDKLRCKEAVEEYIKDTDPECTLSIGADMREIRYCYSIFKRLIKEKSTSALQSEDIPQPIAPVDTGPYNKSDIEQLKQLVEQRDNEINILVNMLKKEKKYSSDAEKLLKKHSILLDRPQTSRDHRRISQQSSNQLDSLENKGATRPVSDFAMTYDGTLNSLTNHVPSVDEYRKTAILGDMSIGRQEAFELFQRDYVKNSHIEDNKNLLKVKFGEAKDLGAKVNNSRLTINKLKGQIEQHRMSLVMQGLVDPNNREPDDQELRLRQLIDEHKLGYRDGYTKLKDMKTEIEHMQHFLETSKVRLLKDFELWWAKQVNLAQEKRAEENTNNHRHENSNAWGSSNGSSYSRRVSTASLDSHPHALMPHPPSITQPVTHKNSHSPYSSLQQQTQQLGYTSRASDNPTLMTNIPLTGDSQADADIIAFVKARQKVLNGK